MGYIIGNPGVIWSLLLQHLALVGIALLISVAIAVPLSLLLWRYGWLNVPVMGTLGALYTIPSIALIILLIPIFGLNAVSVIVALVIYSQIILVRNMVAGLKGIDASLLEAALGMGMNAWQRWWRVQLPLALPAILAGVRIAALTTIAIATIGAMFGAGGLGTLLFDGVAENRYDKIWAGAITVSALALGINWGLQALGRSRKGEGSSEARSRAGRFHRPRSAAAS